RTDPATGNGTSANTSLRAGRTCPYRGSKLRCCRPLIRTNGPRAWRKSIWSRWSLISRGRTRRDSGRSAALTLARLASSIAINREGWPLLRWWRCDAEREIDDEWGDAGEGPRCARGPATGMSAADAVSDQSDSLAPPDSFAAIAD